MMRRGAFDEAGPGFFLLTWIEELGCSSRISSITSSSKKRPRRSRRRSRPARTAAEIDLCEVRL